MGRRAFLFLSNARWTGVPLPEALRACGAVEHASVLLFHAADGYYETIPMTKALEQTTLSAWAMNGEPLPRIHGAPLRMITPGLYGEKNPKWLTQISVLAAFPLSLHLACPPIPEPQLHGKCALTVMIKAPRPGQSKTRLTPPLRSEDAAELSRCFYQDTADLLAEVTALNAFGVQAAAYAPAGSESEFIGLVRPGTMMIPQRQVALGERLFGVAEDLFSVGSAAVALIDSDSPTVPPACYLELLEVLRSDPDAVVLGPTDDGGYYVLGICHALPVLFEGIAWSTNRVFAQTLERIKSVGLRPHVLPQWHDVDDFASLQFLDRELRGELPHRLRGYPARRTRARLGTLAAQGWLEPANADDL